MQSKTLVTINSNTGKARSIKSSSLLESASGKILKALKNRYVSWKLKTDLINSSNQLLFFTPNSNEIQVMDLETMHAFSMTLPFTIDSLIVISPERWFVQNTMKDRYVLEKDPKNCSCPNILKKIDQSNEGRGELEYILACGEKSLKKDSLSLALSQNIHTPGRIISTNDTFVGMIVGVSELSNTNQIFTIPRNRRIKSLHEPIITEDGQIIRIISASEVLPSYTQNETASQRSPGYIEITDPLRKTLRYIMIPK